MVPESRTAAAPRSSRALSPWRSMLVTSSSTKRAPGWCSWRSRTSCIRETVCTHPALEVGGHLERRAERPPRRHHQQVSGEPAGHLGQLGVRADGQGVAAEPGGLAGQPTEPEAVPVALRDRHEPGLGLGDRAQVRAPAVPVDREGEAHRARAVHGELEAAVEQRSQGEVPLAGVLDRLAAGADLELDQAGVRVVGVEGVGDAPQVVDARPRRQGVAHHRPLDGVRAADVALLGGRGAVGVPRVGADADRDRRRDEVALVVGQPEREPVGLLAAHGLGHGPEVAQRARREVVALGRVHVEVVERLEVGRAPSRRSSG